MPNRILIPAACLAIALAMALAVVLQPRGLSPSHDPFALVVAVAEPASEIAGHGHLHDDGAEDAGGVGSIHDHDPGDHTHDQSGTLQDAAATRSAMRGRWTAGIHPSMDADTGPPPERPPRSIPAV